MSLLVLKQRNSPKSHCAVGSPLPSESLLPVNRMSAPGPFPGGSPLRRSLTLRAALPILPAPSVLPLGCHDNLPSHQEQPRMLLLLSSLGKGTVALPGTQGAHGEGSPPREGSWSHQETSAPAR